MTARMLVLVSMSAVLLAHVAKAEAPRNDSTAIVDAKREVRSIAAIRADASAALAAEAKSRRLGDNPREVRRLIELYREMAAHPKHDTSDSLKEVGLQVRSRLVTVRDRIERKLPGRTQPNFKQAAAAPETRVLAQQLPPARGAQAGGLSLVTGGSRAVTTQTDFGPELVELIQTTISPATWNINGGPGAIVYYSPRRVLVVAAPDDVHSQIGGVLQQLNAAQRRNDGAQVVAEVGAVRARE